MKSANKGPFINTLVGVGAGIYFAPPPFFPSETLKNKCILVVETFLTPFLKVTTVLTPLFEVEHFFDTLHPPPEYL